MGLVYILIGLLLVVVVILFFLYSKNNKLLKENHFLKGRLKVEEYNNNFRKEFYDAKNKKAGKLPQSIVDAILENIEENYVFVHYTKQEAVARKILSEGFRFVNSFHKTCIEVPKDEFLINFHHKNYKEYGTYIILIEIGREVYKAKLKQKGDISERSAAIDMLFSIPIQKTESGDSEYIIPSQYIKSYVNYVDFSQVKNPHYNPRVIPRESKEYYKI